MAKKDLLNFIGDREQSLTARAHAIVSNCGSLTPIEIVCWGENILESLPAGFQETYLISELRKLVRVRKIILETRR